MPTLVRLKDGRLVRAEGNVTPEKLAKIGATAVGGGGSVTSNPVKGDPSVNAEVDRRMGNMRKMNRTGMLNTVGDSFVDDLTFGATRKVASGLMGLGKGAYTALKEGSISKGVDAGMREYEISDSVSKRVRQEQAANNPVTNTAFGIAGMLANPIGAETGLAKVATKVAPRAMSKIAASGTGKVLAKVGNSDVIRAARAGGNQAAVQAALNGENIGDAYATGGLLGGIAGGAIKAGGKVVRTFKDRSLAGADRVAAQRAGQMISRARDDAGNKLTPMRVTENIAAERAAGNNSAVMDISPESMFTAGALARKPGLSSSNELIRFGENRIDDAGTRFNDQLNKSLSPNGEQISATQGKAALKAERKVSSETDYGDDIMKAELQDTPDMIKFLQDAPQVTRQAMREAAENLGRDEKVAKLALEFDDAGKPVFTKIPNMAVLDNVLKSLDTKLGQAVRDNNGALIRTIKSEMDGLRKIAGDQNPAYLQSRANQRGFFEKEAALKEGETFLTKLQRQPEQLLMDLKGSKSPEVGLKYGIVDAILALRHTKTEPLKALRQMMRSKEQRDVMKWVFGDEKKFRDFYKFMSTELRNSTSDSLTARGRQSATSVLQNFGEASEGLTGDAADLAKRVSTGTAFGGGIGAASAALRWNSSMGTMSKASQDKLAQILLGEGKGLSKQVAKAKAFDKIEKRKARRAAFIAGKATGAYVGSQGD